MKKYTKEQIKAIDNLIVVLDELENKPRRLFFALEEVAGEFGREESVPSIRDAQNSYYGYLTQAEALVECLEVFSKYKIKQWGGCADDIGRAENNISVVREFIAMYIQRLTDYIR